MIGLITDMHSNGKFRKRNIDPENIDAVNQHLDDQSESHIYADEKLTIADDIKVDVPPDKDQAVRDMLRKHERIWSDQLREIKATELRIDVRPSTGQFKSPTYRAGPKTQELEQPEINKQLKYEVIELAMYEWAGTVLLAPKKDGRLRFCIDYRQLNSMAVKDRYLLPRMMGA